MVLNNLVRIRRYERSLPQRDIIINCIVDNELCHQLLINDEHCQLYGHNALTDRYSLTRVFCKLLIFTTCSLNFRRAIPSFLLSEIGPTRLKDLYFLSLFRSCLTNKLFFLLLTTTNNNINKKNICVHQRPK